MQQQQWIAGFYRTQLESTQNLMTASFEGIERIQQLATQAVRQQFDDQLRLVNAMSSRSAEVWVDPDLARPALDRMIDVQRQLADAVVQTNQRVLSVVSSSAQRATEQGATAARGEAHGADSEGYTAAFNTALQQWQDFAHRMLDVFQEQWTSVANESQRQGQRAFDQASSAMQSAGRGLQAGTTAQPSGPQETPPQGRQAKATERKHEMA